LNHYFQKSFFTNPAPYQIKYYNTGDLQGELTLNENKLPKTFYLRDYQIPDWLVDYVDITFNLYEDHVKVHSVLTMRQNPGGLNGPVILYGEDLEIASFSVSGKPLPTLPYEGKLVFEAPSDHFTLTIETLLKPQNNTQLEGLYRSGETFCTQCEAEGFRRITFYPDRPDIMARFKTTIRADKSLYPVLLSNGNRIASKELPDGRHEVIWEDPFRKPCYLFALVAGNLCAIKDTFVTAHNRNINLEIYVEQENIDKANHAMNSLKEAMRWDEKRFGLEYDLDTYMIVAVNDFNMGAMENKGLNIFNSKYVLASNETATDQDFENIQAVIGHEYFHNWTGNRVTCRDWFQLCLKEGLTVFRDQEFTSDLNSRPVKRIQDVKLLRTAQFIEDAGPMSHPIRPESYMEISNFYTLTVYEKGAEVVRMLHNLLGEKTFQEGMKCYFLRHDGEAVTTDDFIAAMEAASGKNLSQFKLWYSQAGTPEITVSGKFDSNLKTYSLNFSQKTPPTPGQPFKTPLHIPVNIGLLDPKGNEFPLYLVGEQPVDEPINKSRILELTKNNQTFTFININCEPIPSLLRNFSAPVKLHFSYSDEMLAFLCAHDSDPFNRWEAIQKLALKSLISLVRDYQENRVFSCPELLISTFERLLSDPDIDDAFKTQSLTLPNESYLSEQFAVIDVEAIYAAHHYLTCSLATLLYHKWFEIYKLRNDDQFERNGYAIGRRSLKNLALHYLSYSPNEIIETFLNQQFYEAKCMTDEIASLVLLERLGGNIRDKALEHFHHRWRQQALVIDKWFTIQATSKHPDTFKQVQRLVNHPDFTFSNPNRVRALLATFSHSNFIRFHQKDGQCYHFLALNICYIDTRNPQLASRLAQALSNWRRFDLTRASHMKNALQAILEKSELSKDTFEIVEKSLV